MKKQRTKQRSCCVDFTFLEPSWRLFSGLFLLIYIVCGAGGEMNQKFLDSLHFCRLLRLRCQIQLLWRKCFYSWHDNYESYFLSLVFVLISNLCFYMIHSADFHHCSKISHFFLVWFKVDFLLQVWLIIIIVIALSSTGDSRWFCKGQFSL